MSRIQVTRPWFNNDHEATQRAALWSAYFHRFFGPVRSNSEVPAHVRPMSCGQSCDALLRLHEDPTTAYPRAHVVRRCVPQMLYAGFRPRPERADTLHTLLCIVDSQYKAAAAHDRDLALQAVLHQARQQYGSAPVALAAPPRKRTSAAADITADTVSRPTRIAYEGHVFTATSEFLIPCPVEGAAHLVNPENWTQLGSAFKTTSRVDPPRGKRTAIGAQPWSGRLHETFVINWSMFSVQSFETFLKVDYTVAADVVRTDYSLEYEVDDQLIADDGFMEVRKVPGHENWTRYTGQKSVRFASSFLNLLAPAIICMSMDDDADTFRNTVTTAAKAEEHRLAMQRTRMQRAQG